MTAKILAVVWKNLLLRRNHWITTIFEIITPLALLLVLNIWVPKEALQVLKNEDALNTFVSLDVNQHCFQNEISTKPYDKIFYSPSNPITDNIMIRVSEKCGYKKSHMKGGDFLLEEHTTYKYSVVFNNVNDSLDYTIYPSKSEFLHVAALWYSENSFLRWDLVEDVLELQHAIDESFIAMKTDKPHPCVKFERIDGINLDSSFYTVVITTSIFFAYSFIVAVVITRIVEEKQSGSKELMLMMGLKSNHLWIAKFLDAMIMACSVVSGMVFLLYIPLSSQSSTIQHLHPLIFWIVLMLGMIAVICFAFSLSCWFNSATFAALFTVIIGILSCTLVEYLQTTEVAKWKLLIYCLLPHVCLTYSNQILLNYEQFHKNVKWFERMSVNPNALTLSEVFMMLIFDIFIYSLLTWYLDKIRPGKYGVPKPYNFFFRKSFTPNKVLDTGSNANENAPLGGKHKGGISVSNLRKEYHPVGRPPVLAVDNLTLDVPKGEIITLLGHNGAGKSTTMSIITGLIPATSGCVVINGFDIVDSPEMARRNLGLCPQQDLLFPDLTSLQILTFFGMIKGLTYKEARTEAKQLLIKLKMEGAEHRYSQNLSGGMKRKLSLGIAIIGGSSVLILDEPTSGVDPELRREICDLLLSFKGERTILLTTHIMEEADAISDRIAIMDHGKIKCFGSPMDLKTKYGTGYLLSVVLSRNEFYENLLETIQRIISGSRFKSCNACIMNFQLPECETAKYSTLFAALDEAKNCGNINSYSLSISTLEDVFLRVGDMEKNRCETNNKTVDEPDSSPYKILSSRTELNESRITGIHLYMAQFAALLSKKWLQLKRSPFQLCIFSAAPILLILLSIIIPWITKHSSLHSAPVTNAVDYSSNPYSNSEVFYALSTECQLHPDECEKSKKLFDAFDNVSKQFGFYPYISANISQDFQTAYYNDLHNYLRHIPLAFIFEPKRVIIYYSKEAVHIRNVATNLLHNTFLVANELNTTIHTVLNGSLATPEDHLKMLEDFGQPRSVANNNKLMELPELSGLFSLFFMHCILQEIRYGAKALQLMATPSWLYWTTHLVFDMFVFIIYMFIIVGLFILEHGGDAFVGNKGLISGAIILWGSGLIMISYLLTFFTKSKSSAICVGLLIFFVFTYFVPDGIDFLPRWLIYLHPTSIWKVGIVTNGCYLWSLTFYCIGIFIILLILESNILGRLLHRIMSHVFKVHYNKSKGDSDVCKEETQVSQCVSSMPKTDTVLVNDLKRWYFSNSIFKPRRTAAVRGVSFRLSPGDCFGLLGVNGAGKSTTFNMLTGQITCSSGDAMINGAHLGSLFKRSQFLSYIAYCPQTSGIIPTLKGRELLEFFARLRGFKPEEIDESLNKWLTLLKLEEYADRECGRYSGGMERKLSAAIAFTWGAEVVLLDEPTSGVDPTSRRHIWRGVVETQRAGRSLILTSHSMEECEALCSRVAIMVEGGFRVIGEPCTLKDKFGGGYSVQIKLAKTDPESVLSVKEAMKREFPNGCTLSDKQCSILHYHVSEKDTPWGVLFQRLEGIKQMFPDCFESYMASETSLEEIFLHFAGHRTNVQVTEIV